MTLKDVQAIDAMLRGMKHQAWRRTFEYKHLRHFLISRHHNLGKPVRCEHCRISVHGNGPQLHHLPWGYDSFEDYIDPLNIEVLCKNCHKKEHGMAEDP